MRDSLNFVDLAAYFGANAFKRIANRSGFDAAIAWLHDPDSSFRKAIATFMVPADRQEVRRRILAGEVPDGQRVFAFADTTAPAPYAGGVKRR